VSGVVSHGVPQRGSPYDASNMDRTISVIMPCFNCAAYVQEAVASVLGQSHRELELIVVDDGSTDASRTLLDRVEDPRVRRLSQSNRGVCAARNRGLSEARGQYVAFLDADDTWEPKALEALLRALETSRDAVLAYCGWRNVGLPGRRGEPFVPPEYEGEGKLESLFTNCRWPIHAALTRREAVEGAGGFDERFRTSEDYLLWLKIGSRGRIVRVAEVLAYYRHHTGPQATKDRGRVALTHLAAQQAFLRENPGVRSLMGRDTVRRLTYGELLNKGRAAHWQGDLAMAQALFRRVMRGGYGGVRDWVRMLPAVLPLNLYATLVRIARGSASDPGVAL